MGRSKSRRCNGISVLSQFLGGQLGLYHLIPANLIYCMFLTSTKTCMGMRHDFHSMENTKSYKTDSRRLQETGETGG